MNEEHWEFDCPQFVDFHEINRGVDDNVADQWFEIDHETGRRVSEILGQSGETVTSELQINEEVSRQEEKEVELCDNNHREQHEEISVAQGIPSEEASNEVDGEENNVHSESKTPSENQVRRRSLRNTLKKVSVSSTPPVTNAASSRSCEKRKCMSVNNEKFLKKMRSSWNCVRKRSLTLRERVRTRSVDKKSALTLPHTPQVLKRALAKMQNVGSKLKSTEEQELEKMKQFRQQMSELHKKSLKSYEKAKQGCQPVKANHFAVTIPTEFHFATDSRVKSHNMETRQDDQKSFIASLRCNNPTDNKVGRPKLTKPVPFHFSEIHHAKKSSDGEKSSQEYKSMAELIQLFHQQTPTRFHTNPVKGCSKSKEKKNEGHITHPISPKFQPRQTRKRKADIISHEEQEQLAVEEMKRYKFKANPLDERMFKYTTGIKKVSKANPTKPTEFDFEIEKRIKQRKSVQPVEIKYEFKANPVPATVLAGPSELIPVKKVALTLPQSPAFALRSRSLKQKINTSVKEEPVKLIKANPMPHQGAPFIPKLEMKITVLEPFTFDERDKEIYANKEEKIRKELKESSTVPKFTAQPLPPDSPHGIPKKHPKQNTDPKPFQFLIDYRAEEKAEKWQKQIEEELKKQKAASNFKANPCVVPYKEPFKPKPSTRALTDISAFELNTERRATEREEIEMFKKAREAELRSISEQREQEAEEENKLVISKMRKERVHKPQPIMKFKPIEIKPSSMPLTMPLTPRFSKRTRSSLQN